MGSGKSSSASQSKNYYGTIAGALGIGPFDAIVAIILSGKYWYNPGEALERTADGVSNPYTIADTREGARDGKLHFYWGTEDQPASPVINAYISHPPLAGAGYFVLENFLFGTGAGTPPVFEFVLRRGAQQEIITVDLGALTSTAQVNPAATIAEVFTAWHCLGRPASEIDVPRLEALGQEIAGDPELLDLAAGSPLWADQAAARSLLLDLAALGDFWFRLGSTGKIEVGRWSENGPSGAITTLDANDFVGEQEDKTQDLDEIKNTVSVSFFDRAYSYAKSSEAVPDSALVQRHGGTRTQKINLNAVSRRDQAKKHASRALRQYARIILGGSGKVRRAKAVNPDGTIIRPGDWFNLDLDPEPGGEGLRVLCRCLGRISNPTGPVTLEWEVDPSAVPTPYHPDFTLTPPAQEAIPPLYYQRTLSLPPTPGEPPSIQVLALRHKPQWEGVKLYYDDNADGSFTSLGVQDGFALPCSLPAAVASADTTIRLKLVAGFADGVPGDIDAYLLREAVGAGSEAAARNDELVLVLVRKDSATGIVTPNGTLDWVEVCSVVDATQVATDTFDVSVLRGRMGTVPLDFNVGSFPDVFFAYEAWVIPRKTLANFTHLDFQRLLRDHAPGHFRFAPYSRLGTYDPSTAHDAGLQPDADWRPTWYYYFPTGYSKLKNPRVVIVYKVADTAPATPTGGTYDSPVPVGWSLTPGEGPNFSSARLFTEDAYGQDDEWSAPTRWTGIAGDDGADAIISILTNESHTVPADSSGTVTSFGGASTDMKIYVGLTDDTANWTFSKADTNCTTSITDNTVTATAMSADSAYCDITATRAGYPTQTKRFILSKSKAGAAGSAGVNAKLVVLTSDAQTLQIAKNGTITPTSINFTATGQNVTGSPVFSIVAGSATLTGSGNTRNLAEADMATDAVTVKVAWDGQEDYLSVVKVREGADGSPGSPGDSVEIEYSVDGSTSWHGTFTTGDLYMRQRVGTGAWSAAIRIVGTGTVPMCTLTLNVSGAPFNYNTGAGSYPLGTLVTIHADATISGKDFDQWSGSGISQVGNPGSTDTTVLMNGDITLSSDYS